MTRVTATTMTPSATFSILTFTLLSQLVSGAALQFNRPRSWNGTVPTPTMTPAATPVATPASTPTCDKLYWVNHLVFEVTLDEFLEYRAADNLTCISEWNWSSDGCTGAPDSAFNANFHSACLRHDFGYGGFSNLCLLDSDMRESVDKRFSHDLEDACSGVGWFDRIWCGVAKQTYYDAVRALGRVFAKECDPTEQRRVRQ